MMNQEKYNLNWHTYSDHLREMLHEMMKSNELTDVTLVCDDKRQFKAHKIVLSACSSIFKSIINDLPQNSSVIYLRGIQHQEMESILEFMYLGVATFHQERMNEFLNVAKNLEIKEIIKAVEFDDENKAEEPNIKDTLNDSEPESTEQMRADADKNVSPAMNRQIIRESQLQQNDDKSFNCEQSESHFKRKEYLSFHIQSKHEGMQNSCKQCDHQASSYRRLLKHMRSMHEGVKYSCNQCDYQAKQLTNLRAHVLARHEGVKYACNQCDHQASHPSNLRAHIRSVHEGIKISCSQCAYQAPKQSHLRRHIKARHEDIV